MHKYNVKYSTHVYARVYVVQVYAVPSKCTYLRVRMYMLLYIRCAVHIALLYWTHNNTGGGGQVRCSKYLLRWG